MDDKSAIVSQYLAALEMLRQAVAGCPEDVWLDKGYLNQAWNIAYHALFYTRLYLSASEGAHQAWPEHKNYYHEFGDWPEPYSKAEVLAFLAQCRDYVGPQVDALPLDAPSGFHWLPFTRLELHFYNIRHIMLHTGELAERIGGRQQFAFDWVSKQP
ncbi:MAG: DinB family protein [Anaerolineae bacterium]